MTLTEYAESLGAATLVLTKPNCPQCTATKRRLTRDGIPFTEELLSPQTIALAQAEGIGSAPVVVALGTESKVWGGFQPTKLAEIK